MKTARASDVWVARQRRGRGDRGVALVEFAIIMPVLFLLLFGIMEFGWAFYQSVDARHGAREGARLAAVDFHSTLGSVGAAQLNEILVATCDRMDDPANTSIGFHRPGSADVGQGIEVRVELRLDTLTGFLDPFLPEVLTSNVSTRIEQEAQWQNMGVGVVTQCP
jgi:hypothetical protein